MREFAIGHLEELAGRLALPRTQRAVHLGKHIVIGRHVLQDAVVVLHIRAPNSRCTRASLPSRPARPLIWLNSISLYGNWKSTTLRMSGMSTPSPNADVATSTAIDARAEQLLDARALGA